MAENVMGVPPCTWDSIHIIIDNYVYNNYWCFYLDQLKMKFVTQSKEK